MAPSNRLPSLDLGRFDEAWQALKQEVSDDQHPFGQAFQHLGRTYWYASAGDFERVIRDVPRVLADARKLQRAWMIPWADDLLASAIVASAPDGASEASLRASVEAAGGHLAGELLVAAQLRTGNAEAALGECERRLPQLEKEGRVRAYWMFEELRIQALLALDRLHDVCSAVETALSFVDATWLAVARVAAAGLTGGRVGRTR